jgi:hypothetical protein
MNFNRKDRAPRTGAGPPWLARVMPGSRVKRLTHKVIHIGCELFFASLQMKHLRRFLVVACERFEHHSA